MNQSKRQRIVVMTGATAGLGAHAGMQTSTNERRSADGNAQDRLWRESAAMVGLE